MVDRENVSRLLDNDGTGYGKDPESVRQVGCHRCVDMSHHHAIRVSLHQFLQCWRLGAVTEGALGSRERQNEPHLSWVSAQIRWQQIGRRPPTVSRNDPDQYSSRADQTEQDNSGNQQAGNHKLTRLRASQESEPTQLVVDEAANAKVKEHVDQRQDPYQPG